MIFNETRAITPLMHVRFAVELTPGCDDDGTDWTRFSGRVTFFNPRTGLSYVWPMVNIFCGDGTTSYVTGFLKGAHTMTNVGDMTFDATHDNGPHQVRWQWARFQCYKSMLDFDHTLYFQSL